MKSFFILLMLPCLAVASATALAPSLPSVPTPGAKAPVATSSSAILASSVSSSSAIAPKAPLPPPKPLHCTEASVNKALGDSLLALGHWPQAVAAYDDVCPCLKSAERVSCKLLAVRALSQDTSTIQEAILRLDTMAIAAEPEDPGFGELMLTQTALLLKVGNPERALKSWRLAKQVVIPGRDANLKALCTQIRAQWKDTNLVSDCSKIPPLSKPLAATISSSSLRIASSSSETKASATSNSDSSKDQAAVKVNPAPQGSWLLQFGAFSSRDNAELLLKNLKSRKIPSRIVTKNSADKVLWLVQTEPFPSKDAATAYGQSTLNPLGLDFRAIPAP